MRNIIAKGIAILAVIALCGACKKDDSCSITVPLNGAFVQAWGETATLRFETSNVVSVTVTATNGWSGEADLASHTLVITAPESDAENAAEKSVLTLSAVSPGGAISSATVNAYIVPATTDLSADGTANCYIVTKPNMRYSFDATLKGNSQERIVPAEATIVWQTANKVIKHLELTKDGHVEFYVDYDTGSETDLKESNALIGVTDTAGNLIWSWHLWLTNSDPRTEEGVAEYSNGVTFMARNLGAQGNSNGETDTDAILASYGLYYQWGRKDPMPRPRYYNCANNYDESRYNANGNYVYLTVEETAAATGTIAYATAHPDIMLTAPDTNNGDWLQGGNNSLWGGGATKSMYDPCPHGWNVPDADAFTTLDIAAEEDNMDLETAKKLFGWALSDANGEKHFYTGAGYRSYFDGIISNVNYKDEYPYTPLPWVGYYWTRGAEGNKGVAMFFDLNTSRAVINGFVPRSAEYRANAMQVRCVKSR